MSIQYLYCHQSSAAYQQEIYTSVDSDIISLFLSMPAVLQGNVNILQCLQSDRPSGASTKKSSPILITER